MKPEVLIERIRESFDESVLVYTEGSCFRFYLILKAVYPDAKAYYHWTEGHIYTKIGDAFYDIRGRRKVREKGLSEVDYQSEIFRKAYRWKYGK